jgi:mRNA interferase HicA
MGTKRWKVPHFGKWLAEHGCRFDRHEHEKRGEGQVMVTVHREGRKAEVPLGGSHQILDARVVRRACITGTRWNGPRFFGLRDKPEKVGAA